MRTFTMHGKDGVAVTCYAWDDEIPEPLQAVVQIVHGSLEHARRYDEFAGFLARRGIAAYAMDVRGHGRTAGSPETAVYFSDTSDGWRLAMDEVAALNRRIATDHPGYPLFLLGHSMGSFLVRSVAAGGVPESAVAMAGTDEAVRSPGVVKPPGAVRSVRAASDELETNVPLAGLILSGTGGSSPTLLRLVRTLARVTMRMRGRRRRARFLHNLVYGTLNRQVPNPRTPSDFISRDAAVVDAYTADAMCGGTATAEYLHQMMTGFLWAADRRTYAHTPKDLPILIFSGEMDPVAGPADSTREVRRVAETYRTVGVTDVTLTIYPEARHEMLNELNHDEVYADVAAWIKERSASAWQN